MTRRVIIATGCNEAYYPKVRPYMESICRHGNFDAAYLVGVGWNPPNELGFVGLHLPLERAIGHSGIYCVQGGSFLEVLPADDGDVVVFTDGGDVKMQRSLSDTELELLCSLDDRTVLMGLILEGDTLGVEASRIDPSAQIPEKFDLSIPCYHSGVIATTVGAYRRLYERYKTHWDEINGMINHYARQQWLISWILGTDEHLQAQVLPKLFHVHGHYPGHGCVEQGGLLMWKGEPVLFRHKV